MRPFRSRIVTATVLAILMLGSLGSLANADEIPTTSFSVDPWAVPTTNFPEDPWPSLCLPMSGFPEDPWPDS
jgi:hypothetical protein